MKTYIKGFIKGLMMLGATILLGSLHLATIENPTPQDETYTLLVMWAFSVFLIGYLTAKYRLNKSFFLLLFVTGPVLIPFVMSNVEQKKASKESSRISSPRAKDQF